MYITDMSAFYVLTGQVTYRMTYNQSPHIRVRSGIYHFVRRVPADLHRRDLGAAEVGVGARAVGEIVTAPLVLFRSAGFESTATVMRARRRPV